MFSVAVVALALTSCVSGTFVSRDTQPEGWLTEYLEASISPQTADNADIITSLMTLTILAISPFHAKPSMGLNFSITAATLSW